VRRRLLDHVVCPVTGKPLTLETLSARRAPLRRADEDAAKELGLDPAELTEQVLEGVLVNREDRLFYPIVDGVPRLLTFPSKRAIEFTERHRRWLESHVPGHRLPGGDPMPGELDVLRAFSTQWKGFEFADGDGVEVEFASAYQQLATMLDVGTRPLRGRLVLEAGIGLGAMANALVRDQGCELVGVDLSDSVEVAQAHFGGNPFLHVVQASLFALPARSAHFDLVYSYGVLHHTFSTQGAFRRLSELPVAKGRLFVWVYSPDYDRRSVPRRVLRRLEDAYRPICSRLPKLAQTVALMPIVPVYWTYYNLLGGSDGLEHERYGWREILHSARDRFTPRYAHRHSEREVRQWFTEAGYERIESIRERAPAPELPSNVIMNTGVEGIRS
jgi:uncharacterized protein YbaR (Trm112 family)